MASPLRKCLPIIAACTLLLGACGGGGHSSKSSATVPGSSSPSGKSKAGSRTMTFHFSSGGTSQSVSIPPQPIGTSPTTAQGITFQVWVLKRVQPNAVLAVFGPSITRAAGQDTGASDAVLGGIADPMVGGDHADDQIGLLDVGGLKEFQVYENTSGSPLYYVTTCLCTKASGGGNEFEWSSSSSPGGGDNSGAGAQSGGNAKSFLMAALITAPPANVNKVTVVTGFAEIPDLPISG